MWEQKLKATKAALKEWVKNPINTPISHRKENIQTLENLQTDLERKDITHADLEKEQTSQAKAFLSFWQEEEFLRLKSRSLWLKLGDRNSSYFHRQCRERVSKNHISEITTSDGTLHKGHNQIKIAAETHYQNMFKDNRDGSEDAIIDFFSHILY